MKFKQENYKMNQKWRMNGNIEDCKTIYSYKMIKIHLPGHKIEKPCLQRHNPYLEMVQII